MCVQLFWAYFVWSLQGINGNPSEKTSLHVPILGFPKELFREIDLWFGFSEYTLFGLPNRVESKRAIVILKGGPLKTQDTLDQPNQ
jgi:hypothetical protein